MTDEKNSPAKQGNGERTVEQIMDELYVAKIQLAGWQSEVSYLENELLRAFCGYKRQGRHPLPLVAEIIEMYCGDKKSDGQ